MMCPLAGRFVAPLHSSFFSLAISSVHGSDNIRTGNVSGNTNVVVLAVCVLMLSSL
jgi:hypothetical protein